MGDLDDIRAALRRLKIRLADPEGGLSLEEYHQLREAILSDLSAAERAQVTGTPTPAPRTPGRLGPRDGGATELPGRAALQVAPGTVLLKQWRVVRELGRGGFGAVYEAEDVALERTLAVKILDPSMAAREELLKRFRREVGVMRDLAHARIVRVFDYREDPSQSLALISMELVRGCSVRQLLDLAYGSDEAVPPALAAAVFEQTLEALEVAHAAGMIHRDVTQAAGVIHRDVTPGNILLAGGTAAELLSDPGRDPEVKLVDFGIAGLVERSELSAKSRVLGTAAYLAPEVLSRHAEITAAADVYGAGAVAYELLVGEVPAVTGYRPVAELAPEAPVGIADAVTAAVRPDPSERPEVAALLSGLRTARSEAAAATKRAAEVEAARIRLADALEEAREEVVSPAVEALETLLGEEAGVDEDVARARAWVSERREETARAQREAEERRRRGAAQQQHDPAGGRSAGPVPQAAGKAAAGAGGSGVGDGTDAPVAGRGAGGRPGGSPGTKAQGGGPGRRRLRPGMVVAALLAAVAVVVVLWATLGRDGGPPGDVPGTHAVATADASPASAAQQVAGSGDKAKTVVDDLTSAFDKRCTGGNWPPTAIHHDSSNALQSLEWSSQQAQTRIRLRFSDVLDPGSCRFLRLIGPPGPRFVFAATGVERSNSPTRLEVNSEQVIAIRTWLHAELSPSEFHMVVDLTSPGCEVSLAEADPLSLLLQVGCES